MHGSDADAVRLAHLSDIHVTVPVRTWHPTDWFGKRLSAWINLNWLGRGHRFRQADEVLRALRCELYARGVDRLVFSGDATAMGFEEEVAHAARLLGVGEAGGPAGLAVPGNHDYCTHRAVQGGHFERHFAPWQSGERVDEAVYPFAQQVGRVWLVAVNSAVANRWAWDARGRVGHDQLTRLRRLLARLPAGGPRVLVTHYPVQLSCGRPEWRSRHLRDLHDLLAVAREGGIGLWLHGHRHDSYHHHHGGEHAPFPVICAGSATQTGHWSYGEYVLSDGRLHGVRRVFDEQQGRFRDGPTFVAELPRDAAR
jgi:3',5'-cyclic AMP phosphodiesterase CpdA